MIEVCCAIIENGKGEILIAQKAEGASINRWEFVGGKVEMGEDPENALIREVKEELGITISVLGHFYTNIHEYKDFTVSLIAFNARIEEGIIDLKEHKKVEWVTKSKLLNFNFLDADIPIAEKLCSAK